MTVEELEQEVVRLRDARDRASVLLSIAQEHEGELRRRNVSLFERCRYVEHSLRRIQGELTGLLANGLAEE